MFFFSEWCCLYFSFLLVSSVVSHAHINHTHESTLREKTLSFCYNLFLPSNPNRRIPSDLRLNGDRHGLYCNTSICYVWHVPNQFHWKRSYLVTGVICMSYFRVYAFFRCLFMLLQFLGSMSWHTQTKIFAVSSCSRIHFIDFITGHKKCPLTVHFKGNQQNPATNFYCGIEW